jgi:AcrR family transcriptional regulator
MTNERGRVNNWGVTSDMLKRVPPDATATKNRLLKAATAEFAQYGLAGARVDRIGENAKANKRLIYVHFGTKEELFDLVVGRALVSLADTVPFTPDDLPGYAGSLFDLLQERPEVVRLTAWALLERPEPIPVQVDAYRAKLEAISAAQDRGTVTSRIEPVDLMAVLLGLVTAWSNASPALKSLAPQASSAERQQTFRATITTAVRALTTL